MAFWDDFKAGLTKGTPENTKLRSNLASIAESAAGPVGSVQGASKVASLSFERYVRLQAEAANLRNQAKSLGEKWSQFHIQAAERRVDLLQLLRKQKVFSTTFPDTNYLNILDDFKEQGLSEAEQILKVGGREPYDRIRTLIDTIKLNESNAATVDKVWSTAHKRYEDVLTSLQKAKDFMLKRE